MTKEPLPGDSPEDREVVRHWRQQSSEEPSLAVDKRIRDAARADGAAQSKDTTRRVAVGSRWRRFAPLAAAASVALLAVGLVRLMPREEYQAIPRKPDLAPSVAPPRAAPEAKAVSREDMSHNAPAHEGEAQRREADDLSAAPPAARPEQEAAPPVAQPPPEPAVAESQSTTERPSSSAAPLPSTRSEARRSAPTTAREIERAAGLSAIATTADVEASAELPEPVASRVREDASQRTGLDAAAIRIVGVEPITWLDGSLGCEETRSPAPEQRVPGYAVTVNASGTILRYHTDDRDQVRICKDE